MLSKTLLDALPLLADFGSWKELGHIRAISPSKIVVNRWNEGRYARAMEKTQAGEIAPAIDVSRYKMPDGTVYYVPSDGNHRAAVAQDLAHSRIRARISGEVSVYDPSLFYLSGGDLWRRDGVGFYTMVNVAEISAELSATLVEMGVHKRN